MNCDVILVFFLSFLTHSLSLSFFQMSTININIGILGHIDSGKTSIARALSSEASTAAFDKSPQSQERGITLDLGFSAFTVPLPADSRLVTEHGYANAQFTLVDCPGHASLIRTIIGGSQIMDAMLLVIDAVKGIQTQTSEGIVIGSLATSKLVVALNKVDQLSAPGAVKKASERLGKVLSATPFAGAPIIPVAAAPRVADGCGDNDGDGSSTAPPRGIDKLRDALLGMVDESILAKRAMGAKEPFLMAVDHCFTVKGQGTVVTGTVLRGDLKPNDTVEVPELKTQHKVKSIQMFRKPVQSASLGDRIGVALPSLDAKTFERGIVAAPRSVPTVHAVVGRVEKIPYFKEECMSKEKFHITVGHSTVMASVMFFGSAVEPWSREREHVYLDALPPKGTETWVLLEFEKPLSCPTGAVFIGSHLDSDISNIIIMFILYLLFYFYIY